MSNNSRDQQLCCAANTLMKKEWKSSFLKALKTALCQRHLQTQAESSTNKSVFSKGCHRCQPSQSPPIFCCRQTPAQTHTVYATLTFTLCSFICYVSTAPHGSLYSLMTKVMINIVDWISTVTAYVQLKSWPSLLSPFSDGPSRPSTKVIILLQPLFTLLSKWGEL